MNELDLQHREKTNAYRNKFGFKIVMSVHYTTVLREVHWILPSWQVAELSYEYSLPIKILCLEELYYTDAIANVWLHMNSESLGTILWLFLDKANSNTSEKSMAGLRKWKDQNEESHKSDQCYSTRKKSQSFLSVSGSLPYIIWFSTMEYLWFHRRGLDFVQARSNLSLFMATKWALNMPNALIDLEIYFTRYQLLKWNNDCKIMFKQ